MWTYVDEWRAVTESVARDGRADERAVKKSMSLCRHPVRRRRRTTGQRALRLSATSRVLLSTLSVSQEEEEEEEERVQAEEEKEEAMLTSAA